MSHHIHSQIIETIESDNQLMLTLAALELPPLSACLFNALTNSVLIAATIRTRSLRSSCHFLIAADAACNIFAQSGIFIHFTLIVLRQPISLANCFYWFLVPLVSLQIAEMMPLIIALDRLVNVLFPLWINKRRERILLIILLFGAFAITIVNVYLFTTVAYASTKRRVMCSYGDIFLINSVGILATTVIVISTPISIITYIIIGLRIRFWKHAATNRRGMKNVVTKRLYKSLVAIVFLTFTGWLLPLLFNMILVKYVNIDTLLSYALHTQISGISTFISSALVPVVLWAFSVEYRKAFHGLSNDIGALLRQIWQKFFPNNSLATKFFVRNQEQPAVGHSPNNM